MLNQALLLKDFWTRFHQNENVPDRIFALKQYSGIKLNRRKDLPLYIKRAKFNKNKRDKFRYLDKYCRVCNNAPVIRHHIIMLSNGGKNNMQNVIEICKNCHKQIHPWMN